MPYIKTDLALHPSLNKNAEPRAGFLKIGSKLAIGSKRKKLQITTKR